MTIYTGDELVPDANMVFDTRREIAATPREIWPWLVQLGKGRAGWYLPRRAERFIPASRRARRVIDPHFQQLAPGQSVPDYGGREETLDLQRMDAPLTLVYTSERRGAVFSWALLLRERGPGRTEVHLRFRGRIRSGGLKRRTIVAGGRFFDRTTSELMLAGLAERVEPSASSR